MAMESENTPVGSKETEDIKMKNKEKEKSPPKPQIPKSGTSVCSSLPEKKKKSGKSNHQPIKRKRKREEGAPKLPQTGYVRYVNSRRDSVKQEFPEKTCVEHTKMIADEWNHMSDELKKPYLQAAEADKERYNKLLIEFHKQKKAEAALNAERAQEQQNQNVAQKLQNNSKPTQNILPINGIKQFYPPFVVPSEKHAIHNGREVLPNNSNTIRSNRRYAEDTIPIFTDEFLEHNKTVDSELRVLRKSNIDYEQQNSVLEKHIENMKFGVEKMETENSELLEKNRLLETYLQKLKIKLAQAFAGLAIPTEPNGATLENIDKYMTDLYNMASSNSHGPASLNKAKDIIRKLDLQIQL